MLSPAAPARRPSPSRRTRPCLTMSSTAAATSSTGRARSPASSAISTGPPVRSSRLNAAPLMSLPIVSPFEPTSRTLDVDAGRASAPGPEHAGPDGEHVPDLGHDHRRDARPHDAHLEVAVDEEVDDRPRCGGDDQGHGVAMAPEGEGAGDDRDQEEGDQQRLE